MMTSSEAEKVTHSVSESDTDMQQESDKYTMRISRLTVDKLGIQMYDRVSAVLAELIANCYDADSENVTIRLPFGQFLARRSQGRVIDQGFEIHIQDDGCGMTSDEINEYYLNVGYNRRVSRSERTPRHGRRVMGRKGIGKLAPFGICHIVEVISAGGNVTDNGFPVSNLILNLDDIVDEKTDANGNVLPYHPQPGSLDGTFAPETGTRLILRQFDRRRVPERDDLGRQMAARFGLRQATWRVQIFNSDGDETPVVVGNLNVDLMDNTRICVDNRPVQAEDRSLPVSGWVAYAKDPYKDETMAGVRLFARGKIVAQTRDFDIKSGFTGEFKMRSYLTGEIHAEWLDEDEDCVRTDRQDIIWNSELGTPLREWGRDLLKELAARASESARKRVWEIFLAKSRLKERLEYALPNDRSTREETIRLARLLVSRADRDTIQDIDYIERIVNLAYAMGPHSALIEALQEVSSVSEGPLEAILEIFERARVAEIYSLGQVARGRVGAIQQLRRLIADHATVEDQLQKLIERSPWLLYPDWTPLSRNQTLATTRKNFETWYMAEYQQEITTSAIENPNRNPDFVMLNHQGWLEAIEIKRPQHRLTDTEFGRAFKYYRALNDFLEANREARDLFRSARLTIVCDHIRLTPVYEDSLLSNDEITRKTWTDVLQSSTRSHEDFVEVVDKMQGTLPGL